jgi:hypothetical protein
MTTRHVIADHSGQPIYRRDVLPLPDGDGHTHTTYIEGCWGCVLTLPFGEQAARVRRRQLGLCVRGCDDEATEGGLCVRCAGERFGETA